MNIFIKGLKRQEVNTVRGLAAKWLVTDESGKMFDSWIDQWNQDWKEGQTITIDSATQIKSRVYNGKTYDSIIKPMRASAGMVQRTANIDASMKLILDNISAILGQNTRIMKEIEDVKRLIVPRPDPREDRPQSGDEMFPGDEFYPPEKDMLE